MSSVKKLELGRYRTFEQHYDFVLPQSPPRLVLTFVNLAQKSGTFPDVILI